MSTEREQKLFEILQNFYKYGHDYHTIRTPQGFVLKGKWDMSKYLEHYKIPNDLSGKKVLEVGAGNGYFSYELEKRGADVLATDKIGIFWREELSELMNSKVKFMTKNIRWLNESFGKFDLVFCSHMLQHDSDIYGNIVNVRKVTKNMAILCTQIFDNPVVRKHPLIQFVNEVKHIRDSTWGTFFKPNMTAFKTMALSAGFRKVEEASVHLQKPNFQEKETLCGIIHCYV